MHFARTSTYATMATHLQVGKHMETELKLLIEPSDAEALRKHPLFRKYAADPPHEQTLTGIYFDTPNYDLRRADAGLRVRRVGSDWVQTLKVGGQAVGGLHQRQEWESKVAGPAPDLDALRELVETKSDYAKLLDKLGKLDLLHRTFATQVKRTVWELTLPEGDEVECAIDEGSIEYGSSKVPIGEVELELKSGEPKRLFDLALQLQQDIPLHIGNLSKADRGYGLMVPHEVSAVKATSIRLDRKMTVETAFRSIVENCLAQIQANEPGVTRERDIESVHQMRVGLRRLRSALSMFKDVIRCPENIAAELKWLGTELGAARDWDVLTESTLSRIGKEIADKAANAPVRKAAQETAKAHHDEAATGVLSPRYTKLVLEFYSWVQGSGWRQSSTEAQHRRLQRPIGRFADEILSRDQQRLRKRGRRLKGANPETRHMVRIAAKKTRYATEFFQSLYPTDRVLPYVKALSRLQDNLGRLNDASVGATLLQDLSLARPEISNDANFVRGYLVCRTRSDDIALDQLWTKFKKIALPSWK